MKFRMPILILLFSLLLVSCSGSKLPKIKDPEMLRKDCITLYQQFPAEIRTNSSGHKFVINTGFIPKEKWTEAISALEPFQVSKNKYGIRIWIHGDKKEIEGYYIFFDPATLPPSVPLSNWGAASDEDRLYFKKTKTEGIYEFQDPNVLIE